MNIVQCLLNMRKMSLKLIQHPLPPLVPELNSIYNFSNLAISTGHPVLNHTKCKCNRIQQQFY